MELLYLLEKIRIPALDFIMSGVTYLGDQTVFIVIAFIFYWCIDKRKGCFILMAGLTTTLCGQVLKLVFKVPRPWVKDPNFKIVESARSTAGGYSFPSGHSQNSFATFSAIILTNKSRILRIISIIIILAIPFSRMYLGVHTPLDVLGGMAISLVVVAVLFPFFRDQKKFEKSIFGLMIFATCAMAIYTALLFMPVWGNVEKEMITGAALDASKLLGAVLAFDIALFADTKKVHFKTEASPLAQALKLILGLGLLLAVKELLKIPFNAIFDNEYLSNGVRYFIVTLGGGILWPLTFPLFCKIGKK